MRRRILIEVIVQSVADACEAARGGADRLEVVRDILDGGLTPPLSLVRAIAAETTLPLRVIVRENAGYALEAGELLALRGAAADLAAFGGGRDASWVLRATADLRSTTSLA